MSRVAVLFPALYELEECFLIWCVWNVFPVLSGPQQNSLYFKAKGRLSHLEKHLTVITSSFSPPPPLLLPQSEKPGRGGSACGRGLPQRVKVCLLVELWNWTLFPNTCQDATSSGSHSQNCLVRLSGILSWVRNGRDRRSEQIRCSPGKGLPHLTQGRHFCMSWVGRHVLKTDPTLEVSPKRGCFSYFESVILCVPIEQYCARFNTKYSMKGSTREF